MYPGFYRLLLLVLLLPISVYCQQARPFYIAGWEDSLIIRLHVTGLLSNYLGDYSRNPQESRDTNTSSFTNSLLPLLRYNDIAATGYHHVRFKKVDIVRYPEIASFIDDTLPVRMGLLLDSIMAQAKVLEQGFLDYDSDGFLLRKNTIAVDSVAGTAGNDTVSYGYQRNGGKLVSIGVTGTGHSHFENPGYSSTYCGKIKGRLNINTKWYNRYVFNENGLLASLESDYRSIANNCNNYEPNQRIFKYEYDPNGRLERIYDSSLGSSNTVATTYRYTQVSLTSILRDSNLYAVKYPALRLPQVYKWLSAKDQVTVLTRSTEGVVNRRMDYDYKTRKFLATGKPASAFDWKEEWVVDANCRTWAQLAMPNNRNPLTLYQYGNDRKGPFMCKYDIAYLPAADTTTYDPNENRVLKVMHGGCVITQYYEPRKGSIMSPSIDYTERSVYGTRKHSQLIMYGRYYTAGMKTSIDADFTEWAPIPLRAATPARAFTNFVLTRPDGLVSYIFQDNALYALEYE